MSDQTGSSEMKPRHLVAGGVAILFAAMLLIKGVPIVWASAHKNAVIHVENSILIDNKISQDAVIKYIGGYEKAVNIYRDPEYLRHLAFGKTLLSRYFQNREIYRNVLLKAAEGAVTESLMLAPPSPHGWSILATVSDWRGRPPEDVARRLMMSYRNGPYVEELIYGRLKLAFKHWAFLSEADQQILFREMRVAWHLSPQRFVDHTLDPFVNKIAYAALSLDEEIGDAYRKMTKWTRDRIKAKSGLKK